MPKDVLGMSSDEEVTDEPSSQSETSFKANTTVKTRERSENQVVMTMMTRARH